MPVFLLSLFVPHPTNISLSIPNKAYDTRNDAVPADVSHVDVKPVFRRTERRKDGAISSVDCIAESVRPNCQIRHAIPFFYPAQGSVVRNSAVNTVSAIIRVVLLQKYPCTLGLVLAHLVS